MTDRWWSLAQLVERFGGRVEGNPGTVVRRASTLEEAGGDAISFLANPKYRSKATETAAGALVVGEGRELSLPCDAIVTTDPYLYFTRVVALMYPSRPSVQGVHASAVCLGEVCPSASIGPNAAIDAGAVIGERAQIGAGCWIGEGVRIGEDSIIHANVSIYPGCVIGARCIIHSGAVIGADGFGFAPDQGTWSKIPQVGCVVIGDDVEIGANSTVDRGTLSDTRIEDGVKIDNQVQIAHNVKIGAHTAIAGCVGIAGSTRVGRHCAIGGAAGIIGHLEIVDHVTISAGTLVTSSISQPGTYTGVFPMAPHASWRRVGASLRQLDQWMRRVRELEKRLEITERKTS